MSHDDATLRRAAWSPIPQNDAPTAEETAEYHREMQRLRDERAALEDDEAAS